MRAWIDIVCEARTEVLDLADEQSVGVWKGPTARQLRQYVSDHGVVRGIISATGLVYAWPAPDATHAAVADSLDLPYARRFIAGKTAELLIQENDWPQRNPVCVSHDMYFMFAGVIQDVPTATRLFPEWKLICYNSMESFEEHMTESWDATHRLYDNSDPTDFWRDPTPGEFRKLFHAHQHGLRGMYHDGALVVWDAYAGSHGDGHDAYQNREGEMIGWPIFYPDHVMMNDLNMDRCDQLGVDSDKTYVGTLAARWQRLREMPAVKAFYGAKPHIVGVDNDTGEKFDMTPDWVRDNTDPSG